MKLEPEATLDASTRSAIADAFGLGQSVDAKFVARGAMGAVNRLGTLFDGERHDWTVKRSFWNQYSELAIAKEVEFTRQCESVGVPAPRSIQRSDGEGYVLTVSDQLSGGAQYRVLDWVEGEVGDSDDPRTIPLFADWMARIHNLAAEPAGQPIDPWFVQVTYDFEELAGRLAQRAPDVAKQLRTHLADIQELANLVNTTQESGAVWCHTDIGASNLVWGHQGPQLIDWENAGPLVPLQELGCWVRSMGAHGKRAYLAYRQVGGPSEITDVSHIASSVAVHLNYVGCQAELLLDDDHIEQHDFAREQVTGAAQGLANLHELDQWVKELRAQ